jgi:hypothetical protein
MSKKGENDNSTRNNPTFTRPSKICRIGDVKFMLTGLLVLACALATQAQQRPLMTEDIDTTRKGAIEFSSGVEFLQNAKFPLAGLTGDLSRVGVIRFRTGYASNVEVQVEGTLQNYLAIDSIANPTPIPLRIDGNSSTDFDDFLISVKIRLKDESKLLPGFAMKFGYQMPNTDQSRGIGTNQINVFSKFIAQKRLGTVRNEIYRTNLFGEIGLGIMNSPLGNFSQNDVVLYGLAGIFRVTDSVSIVSEINGRLNTRKSAVPLGTESVGQFRLGTQITTGSLRFDAAGMLGITRYSPKSGFLVGVTYKSEPFLPMAK